MKKFKHSKYRNTGIIFSILSRQVINEALSGGDSNCMDIIKEHFHPKSELYKEFSLYRALMENIKSESKNTLLNLVIDERRKLDDKKLREEKYNLIKKVKDNYDLSSLFKTRLSNYAHLANIYKIFEFKTTDNPEEYVESYDNVLNELKEGKLGKDQEDIFEGFDTNFRLVAFKRMVSKFNDKYKGLNPRQKKLVSKYINENTNLPDFRDFVFREVQFIKNELSEISRKGTNQVQKIKLNEITNLANEITKSSVLKDSHISAMLKYYELIEVLKNA